MFFRLCTRAPCTATVFLTGAWSLGPGAWGLGPGAWGLGPGAFLSDIGLARIEERQLLERDRALLRGPHRRRHLAQVSFVGQVLARQHHALHAERPLEVVLDFTRRARVARLLQVVEHRAKQHF